MKQLPHWTPSLFSKAANRSVFGQDDKRYFISGELRVAGYDGLAADQPYPRRFAADTDGEIRRAGAAGGQLLHGLLDPTLSLSLYSCCEV